jgi:hypothetical protein
MSIFKLAAEIKLIAKELEAAKPKQVYLKDKKQDTDDSPELSQYRTSLNNFARHKDLAPYLDVLAILMDKGLLNRKISRNILVKQIQQKIDEVTKAQKDTDKPIEPKMDVNSIIAFLRKFDRRADFKDYKKHPSYRLLKEILNYIVVNRAISANIFKRPGKFYQLFSAQKEKQQTQE